MATEIYTSAPPVSTTTTPPRPLPNPPDTSARSPASSALDEVGIILPNIHLGSFSRMTIDFDRRYSSMPLSRSDGISRRDSGNELPPALRRDSGRPISTDNDAWFPWGDPARTLDTRAQPSPDSHSPIPVQQPLTTNSSATTAPQNSTWGGQSGRPALASSMDDLNRPSQRSDSVSGSGVNYAPPNIGSGSRIPSPLATPGEDPPGSSRGQLPDELSIRRRESNPPQAIRSTQQSHPPPFERDQPQSSESSLRKKSSAMRSSRTPPARSSVPKLQSPQLVTFDDRLVPVASSSTRPLPPAAYFASPYPKPVYSQAAQKVVPRVEEVCVECMMRDRDMADVDVTTPGVWDRESDVGYQELVRKEELEGMQGVPADVDTKKLRSRGTHQMSEENMSVWLTMNPKEPTARWQTLEAYLTAQAALLEAEHRAHNQAMRESQLLDARIQDAYSQLQRSVCDLGGKPITTGAKALSGVRIRAPRTISGPWLNGQNADVSVTAKEDSSAKRDMTFLENGMILETVDIQREEKEEKARRKREEKAERMRLRELNNRSSTYEVPEDVVSLYSMRSGRLDFNPYMLASESQPTLSMFPSSPNPRRMSTAVPTSPSFSRPANNRASTYSSIESRGKARFLNFKQWVGGPGSDASFMNSGSMMDMHLALALEKNLPQLPHERHSVGPSMIDSWNNKPVVESEKAKSDGKKKKGLRKFWNKLTGNNKDTKEREVTEAETQPRSNFEEDIHGPLAPPPPMNFLVNRSTSSERSVAHNRQTSTPSLPISSVISHPRSPSGPGRGASPPTAPSSILPSPTSNAFPWKDGGSDGEKKARLDVDGEVPDERLEQGVESSQRELPGDGPDATTTSYLAVPPSSPVPSRLTPSSGSSTTLITDPRSRPLSLFKSLPPLPAEAPPSPPLQMRPNSVAFGMVEGNGPNGLPVPNPAFRREARRQSFGGVASPMQRGTNAAVIPGSMSIGAMMSAPRDTGYDEFGASQASLGRYDTGDQVASKRTSRFGFHSLLGGGNRASERSAAAPAAGNYYDERDPVSIRHRLELSQSVSSHSLDPSSADYYRTSFTRLPGASSLSGKRLDELILREKNFVAYRYPSGDPKSLGALRR
ncbi:hypothetical protein BOTBODRAFT_168954 [Botryobasidium botryosum FD-172 SS1]|uniref:Uncharacterized protein n=1 Tax=Botryobasidium botryosum (strain FD-172 SS1) TaxID=930990 RepID=A0A067N157_BOTB1|nr:hypothetical protein BOTBODRAFT_168954 [Botryobasidium botryosum FD-172 SS1]